MRVFRVIALIGFIAFFVGFVAPDHAVAGEKFKVRIVKHNTKWHPIAVPCEGGKVVGSFEEKGVSTNMGGKAIWEGWADTAVGLWEANSKTGVGLGYGYSESTDRDGDKIYPRWEGKKAQGDSRSGGTTTIAKGTGKWEGIQGQGARVTTAVAPGQSYNDIEWDIGLPPR